MKLFGLTTAWIVAFCLLASPALGDVSRAEEEMVQSISEIRQQNGLSPVRASHSLAASAGRYSRWQLDNDYFGHQPQIRMSSNFSTKGEVLRLVIGNGVGVPKTLRLWMNSPAHRNAILYPSMRMAGAGIAEGRYQGRQAVIVTVHLGAR